jgi:DNA-directed RNA polymerase specialized sigma24 family protein
MVHALVWRMACARGESHVADLVQDSLIRVLQNISRFAPAGPARLSTWILTITTRVVLNDRRRDSTRDSKLEPTPCIDPATAVADRELGTAIARAVLELPEAQRITFVLRAPRPRLRRDREGARGRRRHRRSRPPAHDPPFATLLRAHPDLFRGTR